MKTKYLFLATTFLASLAHAEVVVYPDKPANIELSAENPNKIVCNSGDINDMAVPQDLPIDPKAKNENLFLTYQKLAKPDGTTDLITKVHSIHVVCDGAVYSMVVTPRAGQARYVRLGDPVADKMRENLKLVREKSDDQIIADLVRAAYHNELPPNYTVVPKSVIINAKLEGLTIHHVRTISLNGIGLSLKEYVVSGKPGTLTPHNLFLLNGTAFSDKLRGVSVKPEIIGDNGQTRLFVVEDKA